MIRKYLAVAVLAALVSAGCGTQDPAAQDPNAPATAHNDADIAFVREMIPHHQDAKAMAELAEGRTRNQPLLDLASRIAKGQEAEIATMSGWLRDWRAAAPTSGAGGHDAALASLDGDRFDRRFLELMIVHHQGAVDRARTQSDNGRHQPAKELARKITETREGEITELQQLLKVEG